MQNRELQGELQGLCQVRSDHGPIGSPLLRGIVGALTSRSDLPKRLRELPKRIRGEAHLILHLFRISAAKLLVDESVSILAC